MKKLSLLALSLVASASFAQTTLWNGEDVTCTAGQLWGNSTKDIVDNPDKSGVNTSDKCIHFTMNTGDEGKVVKIPFREWATPSMGGSRRVSLMIRKSKSENVQVELSDPTDGSAAYWHKVVAWYGGEGAWQKVTFDFSTNGGFDCPGVISITAQTSDDGADGQEIWIDNVVIEPATTVGGTPLSEIADGSLEGDLKLGGAWMKGDCMNSEGEWTKYEYNDFEALKAKMAADVTSVDMRGCVLKDAYNAFGGNVLVFADQHADGENVVIDGTAAQLHLLAGAPFSSPEGFTASSVTVSRSIYEGYNTLVLPFDVTASELDGVELATFSGVSGDNGSKVVSFVKADAVEANRPMLVTCAAQKDAVEFSGKEVKATPGQLSDGALTGVYAPQSATGLWGINAEGKFQKGGDNATLNAFSAYIDMPEAQSLAMDFSTGIGSIEAGGATTVSVYTLSGVKVRTASKADALEGLEKGIYIVNNEKIIVK